MDKIEYEEWMLKGIHEGRGVSVLTEEEKKAGKTQEKIEVSFPSIGRQAACDFVSRMSQARLSASWN